MRPLAIDLCCGMGGWTAGLLAAGYRVVGFDVERYAEYPGELVLQDVRTLHGAQFRSASLIVASPPCQEFSLRDMPWGRLANLARPDMSIVEACFRIAREACVPMVLENVRGAQRFIGRARWRYGPYYLWGDVPALMPIGTAEKGLRLGRKADGKRVLEGPRKFSSGSPQRKAWSARAAMIPIELSTHIGKCYANVSNPAFEAH